MDDTTHHVVNAVQRGNQRKKNRQDLPSKENPRASTKGACFLCRSLLHLKKDCPQNDCHNKRGPTRQPRIKKIEGDLKANRRYTEVSFGEVRMQLDSGAVINREAWERIGSPTLEKTTTSLGAANRTPIEVLGQFDVQFTCGGHSGHGRCYMAENIEQLLGIEWETNFHLFRGPSMPSAASLSRSQRKKEDTLPKFWLEGFQMSSERSWGNASRRRSYWSSRAQANLLPTDEYSICSGRSSECRAGTSGATRSSEESGLQQLGYTDCY